MGAASQPVEQADTEGSVRMVAVGFDLLVRGMVAVSVEVQMAIAIVLVHVSVNRERSAQGPWPNPYQHHPDHSLAPGRKQVQRQQIAEPKGKQTNHRNAGGMAQAPASAWEPGPPGLARRQGGDGRQVVRTRPDVNDPRNESRDDCDHNLLSRQASRLCIGLTNPECA